ncbi:MAG TPA: ABC transporter ATP-binding protein [Acetobacteraceae bacterium]|nr:ABC transporter ATP-binding protein [Acetobacteraceae bacterium]
MNLSARNVGVHYRARVAVEGVSLEARPGEILAILGANGSGKSSLLRALAGLQAHSGEITWTAASAEPGGIGYMPQDNGARAALTAFEVVLLGRMRSLSLHVGSVDLNAAEAAMAEIGVADLAGRRIGELSGGQRQMVLLAQVLAGDPSVLLLDEPTSALDIAHQLHVLDLLRTATRRRELTTIAVLHDLNAAARFSDRVALMHAGRLAGIGSPRDILCPSVLEPAFGVRVAVDRGSDGHPVVLPLQAVR